MASIKLKGDTSGEITISAPAVAGTTTLELPATSSTLATQNALGVRNLIINGDMRIDQRNAGASITPLVNPTYTIDRWFAAPAIASKFSVQQSTTAPTDFSKSLLMTSLAATTVGASDYYEMYQAIEGYNMAHLNWGTANAKTVTLSFWVRSSLTGTFGGTVLSASAGETYPFTYTISSADTWEQKSITILGPTSGTFGTTNTVGCYVGFNLGAGTSVSGTAGSWQNSFFRAPSGTVQVVATSGATLYITGIQLEVGDTATPFEHRPYDMELARCQRYYENFGTEASHYFTGAVACSSSTRCRIGITYTQKRAAPTITVGNTDLTVFTGASNITSTAVVVSNAVTTKATFLQIDVASGLTSGQAELVRTNSTSNPVEIDAEL